MVRLSRREFTSKLVKAGVGSAVLGPLSEIYSLVTNSNNAYAENVRGIKKGFEVGKFKEIYFEGFKFTGRVEYQWELKNKVGVAAYLTGLTEYDPNSNIPHNDINMDYESLVIIALDEGELKKQTEKFKETEIYKEMEAPSIELLKTETDMIYLPFHLEAKDEGYVNFDPYGDSFIMTQDLFKTEGDAEFSLGYDVFSILNGRKPIFGGRIKDPEYKEKIYFRHILGRGFELMNVAYFPEHQYLDVYFVTFSKDKFEYASTEELKRRFGLKNKEEIEEIRRYLIIPIDWRATTEIYPQVFEGHIGTGMVLPFDLWAIALASEYRVFPEGYRVYTLYSPRTYFVNLGVDGIRGPYPGYKITAYSPNNPRDIPKDVIDQYFSRVEKIAPKDALKRLKDMILDHKYLPVKGFDNIKHGLHLELISRQFLLRFFGIERGYVVSFKFSQPEYNENIEDIKRMRKDIRECDLITIPPEKINFVIGVLPSNVFEEFAYFSYQFFKAVGMITKDVAVSKFEKLKKEYLKLRSKRKK